MESVLVFGALVLIAIQLSAIIYFLLVKLLLIPIADFFMKVFKSKKTGAFDKATFVLFFLALGTTVLLIFSIKSNVGTFKVFLTLINIGYFLNYLAYQVLQKYAFDYEKMALIFRFPLLLPIFCYMFFILSLILNSVSFSWKGLLLTLAIWVLGSIIVIIWKKTSGREFFL